MNTNIKTDKSVQVLHFEVQDISMCINIENIVKVLLLPWLERAPNSVFYLAGLLNYAGESVPVIDLSLRLNMNRSEKYNLETPVLLCRSGTEPIGLIVDKIKGLNSFFKNEIRQKVNAEITDSPFSGTIILNDKLTYLLDMAKLAGNRNRKNNFAESLSDEANDTL